MIYDLTDTLRENMSCYSKSHRKIAEYILGNFDSAAFMTASVLADNAGVSESTVIRFATALGYKGYPELQDALLKTAHNRMTAKQRMHVTRSRINPTDVLTSVLSSDMDKIRLTLENADTVAFEAVIDSLMAANSIYILGVRSSSALSEFLGFYLNLFFRNVHIVSTSSVSEVFEQVIHIDKGDVFVGISFPRYSRRTVKAMKFAGARGAKVIAITDCELSPLCEFSDNKLFAQSDMTAFVDSLVAPLSLVNAIVAAVAIRKNDAMTGVLQELEDIWDENNVYDNKD